eukprot:NODE_206_length_2161_cov_73.813920_g177_i0.p1 GENE.NODE_206_length_2161_cov_73.813920_g177_i0~~NODE_206_length_2161_cov_73.813920_g177_i0.p1  ORF type:complete len:373 (-),score=52.76 NODE_206_length_2161_cov_73.813920_g177_i0:111-1229(-)
MWDVASQPQARDRPANHARYTTRVSTRPSNVDLQPSCVHHHHLHKPSLHILTKAHPAPYYSPWTNGVPSYTSSYWGQQPTLTMPDRHRHPRGTSRKALLIGVGSMVNPMVHQELLSIQHLLLRHGFSHDHTRVASDVDPCKPLQPTRGFILESLRWLVRDAMPGDALFFLFVGPSGQAPDPNAPYDGSVDDTLVPVDPANGHVRESELWCLLVRDLPDGVRLTAVLDCGPHETGLALPYALTRDGWVQAPYPAHTVGDARLFRGSLGVTTGSMTFAFVNALLKGGGLSTVGLMHALQRHMDAHGAQHLVQLTASQRFDANAPFDLVCSVSNSNSSPFLFGHHRKPVHPYAHQSAAMLGPPVPFLSLQQAFAF